MNPESLRAYEVQRASLLVERSSFDAHYRELADHFLPIRTRFTTSRRNQGARRSTVLVDSTPRYAVRTLGSGMHAGLTSPARPWMKLTTPDPTLSESPAVKSWLHLVTLRMLTVFLRTNLYTALPTLYADVGVFGTGAMAMLEDQQDLFRCYNYPIGSYAMGINERGLVDTFTREWVMTVGNLVDTFDPTHRAEKRSPNWAKFSTTVKQLYDRKAYDQPIDVCWFVGPNRDHEQQSLDYRRFPIVSVHYERGGTAYGSDSALSDRNRVLRESGFNEFPVLCPRWDVTGEDTYGTDCPGMTALGDVKALQIMDKRMNQAVEKGITPPLTAPTSLRTQKTSLLPGDITYIDVREGQQGVRAIHEIATNLEHMSVLIDKRQYRISKAFYEDLFLMLQTIDARRGLQPATAREIEERHEEKLLALGPVLERMADELHDPMVDRSYAIMERAGLIPPPPPELEGVELKVEYISIMAQAQKSISLMGLDRFMQTAAAMKEVWPEIGYKVNARQSIDDYGDMTGINPNIIRSDEEADQLMQADAEAQAQAQQAEQLPKIGAGVKALGDTKLAGGGSVLDSVAETMRAEAGV
jgi:hypothetical protein